MTGHTLLCDELHDRPSGVWDYISPSRLNLWLRCPLAFRLKYIDGVPTPSSPAQFVGKVVHQALECYYRHRLLGVQLGEPELLGRLQESWDQTVHDCEMQFDSTEREQFCRLQAIDLTAAYMAYVPVSESRPLAVEAALEAPLIDPVTGEDFGIPLVGIMDLVLADDTGPVIVDFKTASRGSEPMEIVHEVQLTSYAYLFRKASQLAESSLEIRSLIKTKSPRVDVHAFPSRTDAHFRRLFALVRAYLDDLDRGRFVYRPGHACSMCEFRQTQCRAWTG